MIRGNASEILALAGAASGADPGRRQHATRPSEALAAGSALARELGTVVAITGAVDHVTDGERLAAGSSNGDPRMTRVTALGCAASAIVGAFLAVEPDPLRGRGERARGLRPRRRARRGRRRRPRQPARSGSSISWRRSTRRRSRAGVRIA